ncbi:MAG: hypothetical protein JWM91_2394 [Rhodospirillales bacterium]|nr:hypothetical protein [Rhodospirillales bacterium]
MIVVLLLAVGGLFAVGHFDLAAPVSRYLSHKVGRKLAIGSLRVTLGNPIALEVRSVSLANVKGGSQPEMIALAYLKAEIAPSTILFGPMVLRGLTIDGAEILLEHGPDGYPNWKPAPPASRILPKPEGRRVIPALLDAHFHNIEIDVRTSSGNVLRTRLNDVAVSAVTPDRPVSMIGDGSYNGIRIHADIGLPSFSALHTKTAKLAVKMKLMSGTTSLAFEGTAADPLDADGVDGRMILNAPKPRELLALAGFTGQIDLPLTFAGAFSRNDTLWRLVNGAGTLDGDTLRANLQMQEGARHQPDAITIDTAVRNLDLDALVPAGDPKQPVGKMSLLVDPDPGAVVDAHVAAGHFAYRTIQADAFDFKAKLAPGLLTVEQIAANVAGGSAKSRVTITRRNDKGVVDFDGSLNGVDAAKLAKLMGWGPLPVSGPVSSQVSGSMTGATLSEARRVNRIVAVLSMSGGTIDRHLVGMASTDVRSLFGGRTGLSQLICLLAVLDLHDGVGTIAPLTIKTSDGTIVGSGTYDSLHDLIDLTIGTQSSTTSYFALDVPVRISGPVSDFTVRPAFGASRAMQLTGNIADLPGDLRAFAASNACLAR